MNIIKEFYLPVRQTIITIIVCMAVVAGVSLVSAWTGPTQAPPGGNVDAPINVGSSGQIKSGALQVNGFRNLGATILDGNVGIGTTAPSKKLDVQGGSIKTSGKLGTNGFDPDSGYPSGWGGGIHTWDVYAEGSIKAKGDICTDQGGGKCLSAAGGWGVPRYWNFGEDTYSGGSDLGRWCYEGSPIGDTCDGKWDGYYDCSPNDEKTCTDVFCEGDTPRVYKRTITCKANYVYARY